jgi:hypothetical protein
MCGLHFSSVVTTLDGRPMNVQGSVNTAYSPGKVPGLLIKVNVTEVRNGSPIRHKVHFASMRVGQTDTRAMKAVPGEDGRSILLMTNMDETGEFFYTFPNQLPQGAWLSISLDPNRGDYTYRLPEFATNDFDTLKQISECDAVGLKGLMDELQQ